METENGNTEPIKSILDLLVAELKNMYWGEKELTAALPKMAEKASSENLKSALLKHLAETKGHVERIEKIFVRLDVPFEAKKCEIINAMIKAAEGLMEKTKPGGVRDTAIILAAQKVECYEIAVYDNLLSYAWLLEEGEVAKLLNLTLQDEKMANEYLNEASKNVDIEAGGFGDTPSVTSYT